MSHVANAHTRTPRKSEQSQAGPRRHLHPTVGDRRSVVATFEVSAGLPMSHQAPTRGQETYHGKERQGNDLRATGGVEAKPLQPAPSLAGDQARARSESSVVATWSTPFWKIRRPSPRSASPPSSLRPAHLVRVPRAANANVKTSRVCRSPSGAGHFRHREHCGDEGKSPRHRVASQHRWQTPTEIADGDHPPRNDSKTTPDPHRSRPA
jgi:hypothetical protein